MNKIRKGDEVIVRRPRQGQAWHGVAARGCRSRGGRRHQPGQEARQAEPHEGHQGGIVEKAMPIHQSNVAIFNKATGKADRVGIKTLQTAPACACSSPAAKRSRPEVHHGTTATTLPRKVAPELIKKFGYKSPMEVPRITKITLNMGVSEAVADKKVMDNAVADLTKIAGQKPVVTKAKKAIAGFKIREQQAIGCMVTLRGARMYEFLDRFVTVALPRVRDFRGISGARSTAAATTTSASKSRSSSPKSSTTRSTPCAA
jgi:ribosomal protein L24